MDMGHTLWTKPHFNIELYPVRVKTKYPPGRLTTASQLQSNLVTRVPVFTALIISTIGDGRLIANNLSLLTHLLAGGNTFDIVFFFFLDFRISKSSSVLLQCSCIFMRHSRYNDNWLSRMTNNNVYPCFQIAHLFPLMLIFSLNIDTTILHIVIYPSNGYGTYFVDKTTLQH